MLSWYVKTRAGTWEYISCAKVVANAIHWPLDTHIVDAPQTIAGALQGMPVLVRAPHRGEA